MHLAPARGPAAHTSHRSDPFEQAQYGDPRFSRTYFVEGSQQTYRIGISE
jgi:hypothetical protein